MLNWKKVVDNPIPKDRIVLALWKGTICLCEWDDGDGIKGNFWISMMPATFPDNFKIQKEREIKFTHWCELNIPEDY